MSYEDSLFIQKYVKEMTSIMKKVYPKLKKEDIKKEVLRYVEERIQVPSVTLDNNYTYEQKQSNLLSVFDWCIERKPIIAGNGTFYKNQHEAINPIANMLDDFLATRKALKKKMFLIEDTSSWEYRDLDRGQLNEKINANAYYGSSGAKSSAFYSKWSGPATTGGAQSVISTAEQMFEAMLVDNYVYLDATELLHWMEFIITEYNENDIKLDAWIVDASIEDVVDRLLDKILLKDFNDEDIIRKYLKSLDNDQVTYLYYKSNLQDFVTRHKEISNLFITILNKTNEKRYPRIGEDDPVPKEFAGKYKTADEYNKFVDHISFMDPNGVPDNIKEYVSQLSGYFMKYVYSNYISFDKIYRLKNFIRGCVTVIDTDSNFLSLDTVVNFLLDKVVGSNTFGREAISNVFIIVNTLAYIITECSTDIFLTYGEYSNIDEEYRPRFNMKNEFLILRLIIAKTKKRYLSKQYLREGNLLPKPKIDVKGFDFKKATCSEDAEKVFMKLIKKYLMEPDEINLPGMYKELQEFAESVKQSILSNERTYLPLASAKELSAYKDPASEQSVRGVLTWNILNPDNEIDLPSKVGLVKLNVFKEENLESIRDTYPEEYNLLMDNIFNDKTGIFVGYKEYPVNVDYVNIKDKNWVEKIPRKFQSKFKKKSAKEWNEFVDTYDGPNPRPDDEKYVFKKRGIQCIAIPSNGSIPECLMQFVDIDTMVNNILSPFNSVLDIFGLQPIDVGKSYNGVNRKTPKYTNIIKF